MCARDRLGANATDRQRGERYLRTLTSSPRMHVQKSEKVFASKALQREEERRGTREREGREGREGRERPDYKGTDIRKIQSVLWLQMMRMSNV